MLDKVKLAMSIKTTAYDGDIQELIDACKTDLSLAGVNRIDDNDSLTVRAVIFYAKSYFRANEQSADRYAKAYENLKIAMSLSGEYTEVSADDE